MPTTTRTRYTNWGQPYYSALARGHDHGSAAYIANQWEAKYLDRTKGAEIRPGPTHGDKVRTMEKTTDDVKERTD